MSIYGPSAQPACLESGCANRVLKAGDTMTGDLNMHSNHKIIRPADLTNPQDAATKNYVDSLIQDAVGSTKNYVDVQDNLRVLKAGDTMTGELQMSDNLVRGLPTTYPPNYVGDEATSWTQVQSLAQDAVGSTKNYVDVQDDLRVLKAGDTMAGDLNMHNYHKIIRLADPTSPQDAATKKYVDSRKPLITIWAEENESIDAGHYEWSLGNGSHGHARCGYTMMVSGRVLPMGLAAYSHTSAVTVAIVVNGVEYIAYTMTKPNGQYSETLAQTNLTHHLSLLKGTG
jgi:hypothetical protein